MGMGKNKNTGSDFKVSLNKDEQASVEQAAKRHNLAVGDYLREVALFPKKFIADNPEEICLQIKPERINNKMLIQKILDIFKEINEDGGSASDVMITENQKMLIFESHRFILSYQRKKK